VRAGAISGEVLDVGCGTGEHALLAAAHGLTVTGIDASPTAIETARQKARERGLDVQFVVGDALKLDLLEKQFDSLIDSGVFHVFDDDRRREYVASLATVARPGGRLFLLCFSDRVQPLSAGPRRISQAEIREAFADGWEVNDIAAAAFEVTGLPSDEFAAWLATITRS
jgi:ubiquinone/menaquinone biosynthesis C-methylase UbiE